jgi:hypothetical protein
MMQADRDFAAQWRRARASGTAKKDFAADNHKSLKETNRILARVRMANRREQSRTTRPVNP